MSLNLILGCMFSGKTSELLNRYERYTIGNKKCLLVKFLGDTRYDEENVVTHSGKSIASTVVKYLYEIDNIVKNYDVICIDEIQFYQDAHIFCDKWANQGIIVEVSGINGTFNKTPFPIISKLVPQATNITFLKAICRETGNDAVYSYKYTEEKQEDDIAIGGSEMYKAVDRETYNKTNMQNDLYNKFQEFSEIYNKANNINNKKYNVTQNEMHPNISFVKLIEKY